MTHENNKIGGRAEHPGSDEQKISEMLGGLKRVEAPKDFDFHLKARIAKAKPSDYRRAGFLPILKYAVPLALFLVVGAGAMLNSSYVSWKEPVVSVPETPAAGPTREPESKTGQELVIAAAATPSPEQRPQPAATTDPDAAPRLASATAPPRVRSGSVDSHTRVRPQPELPNNSTVRALGVADPVITPVKRVKAKEALQMIGIEAEFENDNWTVRTVKANEAAGHLGVKPGDRIKTIDGQPITEKSEYEGGIKVGRIQVQRGRETVELSTPVKPE